MTDRSIAGWVRHNRGLLAAMVLLALSVTIILVQGIAKLQQRPSVTIGSINGMPVGDGTQLVLGNGLNVLPQIINANGAQLDYTLPGVERPGWTDGVALTQVTNVESLKEWALCSDELIAEADARSGYAAVMAHNTQDRPFTKGTVLNASDKARAEVFTSTAAVLRSAAELAAKADIPCRKPGQPSTQPNWVTVTVKGVALRIPEYSLFIFTMPVEYLDATHRCASKIATDLKRIKEQAIDQKVSNMGSRNTYSEWDKGWNLVVDGAEERLAASQHVSC